MSPVIVQQTIDPDDERIALQLDRPKPDDPPTFRLPWTEEHHWLVLRGNTPRYSAQLFPDVQGPFMELFQPVNVPGLQFVSFRSLCKQIKEMQDGHWGPSWVQLAQDAALRCLEAVLHWEGNWGSGAPPGAPPPNSSQLMSEGVREMWDILYTYSLGY